MHGLIQAFSRTNRILNSIKAFGNIVCFRNLSNEVDEALSLFGDKDAKSVVLLKDYDSYFNGYDENGHHKGYSELVKELTEKYPIGTEPFGEKEEKEFISLFGSLLRSVNILKSFDQFENGKLLSDRQMQDYQSVYLDLYGKYRHNTEKADIENDIIFEIELVKQIEVNIDYILNLVKKYHAENCLDEEAACNIIKAAESSVQLRSKKELIEAFIAKMNIAKSEDHIDKQWNSFVKDEYNKEIEKLVSDEHLKRDPLVKLMSKAFRSGEFSTEGTVLDDCMPPMSLFDKRRSEKKEKIISMLLKLFEKFTGLL